MTAVSAILQASHKVLMAEVLDKLGMFRHGALATSEAEFREAGFELRPEMEALEAAWEGVKKSDDAQTVADLQFLRASDAAAAAFDDGQRWISQLTARARLAEASNHPEAASLLRELRSVAEDTPSQRGTTTALRRLTAALRHSDHAAFGVSAAGLDAANKLADVLEDAQLRREGEQQRREVATATKHAFLTTVRTIFIKIQRAIESYRAHHPRGEDPTGWRFDAIAAALADAQPRPDDDDLSPTAGLPPLVPEGEEEG